MPAEHLLNLLCSYVHKHTYQNHWNDF